MKGKEGSRTEQGELHTASLARSQPTQQGPREQRLPFRQSNQAEMPAPVPGQLSHCGRVSIGRCGLGLNAGALHLETIT